jgi:hypothetical protein
MMRLPFDNSRARRFGGALALALTQLAATACDKMPLSAPTGSTVTLRSTETILGTGGSTDVTAFVSEQAGTPVQNGTVVRFSTNLGRVDPAEVQTTNGYAVTKFMAGDVAGEAVIRASSGSINAAGNDDAPNAVKIKVGAAATETLTLRASPQFVPFEGGTVDLIASVLGANNRVLPGIPVNFGATEGTLTQTSVLTDGNGEARTSLSLKPVQGVNSVTATATSGTKTATVTITRRPAPAIPKVALTVSCATATKSGQTCTFTATVTDTDDMTRPTRYEFRFGDDGSISGTSNVVNHVYTVGGVVRTATVRVTLFDGSVIEASTDVLIPVLPLI